MRKRRSRPKSLRTNSYEPIHKPADTHWLMRFEAQREQADEDLARRLAEAQRREL